MRAFMSKASRQWLHPSAAFSASPAASQRCCGTAQRASRSDPADFIDATLLSRGIGPDHWRQR